MEYKYSLVNSPESKHISTNYIVSLEGFHLFQLPQQAFSEGKRTNLGHPVKGKGAILYQDLGSEIWVP